MDVGDASESDADMGDDPLEQGAAGSESGDDQDEDEDGAALDGDEFAAADADESDDESGESGDAGGLTKLERQSARLEKRQKAEEEDAAAETEQSTNLQSMRSFTLPTSDDLEREKMMPPDVTLTHQRIQDILFVLSDFAAHRSDTRDRFEYVAQLRDDLAAYYGYQTELIEKFMELFAPSELVEFLDANEVQRPMTIRTNTLKTRRRDLAQALINRGVNLDPIGEWSKVGLKIYQSQVCVSVRAAARLRRPELPTQVPIGATPEYLAGHYMLQSAASMLPVMALGAKEGEKVLDMAAAPGGKTTYLASIMKNTGTLVANDFNKARLKSLTANLHRLGVRIAVVTNYDGRELPKHFQNFDRCVCAHDVQCARPRG